LACSKNDENEGKEEGKNEKVGKTRHKLPKDKSAIDD